MMPLNMMLLSYRGVESVVQMEGLSDGLSLMPEASCCTTLSCLPSFLGGILVLALVEIVFVVYFITRVLAKKPPSVPASSPSLEYPSSSDSFSLQGNLWVAPLPEGDWSKAVLQRPGKERDAESDALEIAPVWRHVILKEGSLLLKTADGVEEHISLEGCEVLTISAGGEPNGKWSKRFPIKLHHSTRKLYRDCNNCVFYAKSGYEKEAWCEVLRATARAKTPANTWFLKLKEEFWHYAEGAERHAPYLMKFRSGSNHLALTRTEENEVKSPEEPFSKRRFIWNKLLGRNSKGKPLSAVEDRGKFTQRFSQVDEESGKEIDTQNESTSSDSDVEKGAAQVLEAALVHGGENESKAQKEVVPGLLCLNMVVGRLFFDFYHSESRVLWLQDNIQRLISKIKTPSYIKSIAVRELDLGHEPPFATGIRMLPADAGGALALEVDLEWHGGGFISMETRVDVRDQQTQEKVASHMADPGPAGAAAAAIVSGIEEDLEAGEVSSPLMRKKPGPGEDSSRRAGWMNSMKTMISRVADQVSQVPLLLKIRLVSVKATCIVSLRAPPTDRIWFSFKEMPNIDLVPEPCVGDRRISSGPFGNFIANQIKEQIRECIVMPYCQSLFCHWMMAEQDDWLPESAFPVAFSADPSETHRNLDSKFVGEADKTGQPSIHGNGSPNKSEVSEASANLELPHPGAPSGSSIMLANPPTHPNSESNLKNQPPKPAISDQPSSHLSLPAQPPGARSNASSGREEEASSVLTMPLLDSNDYSKLLGSSSEVDAGAVPDKVIDAVYNDLLMQSEGSASENESHPQIVSQELHTQADLPSGLDSRVSRRTKMFSLGKKVGTKLDERRRIVLEKLREKSSSSDQVGSSRHHGSSGSLHM